MPRHFLGILAGKKIIIYKFRGLEAGVGADHPAPVGAAERFGAGSANVDLLSLQIYISLLIINYQISIPYLNNYLTSTARKGKHYKCYT